VEGVRNADRHQTPARRNDAELGAWREDMPHIVMLGK
jgi:hypothetical protein